MFHDFYGLTGKPFQLTPDPAFYFRSITHRKALSYLGYGLAQGEGFIVVTGEVGAGKSTLIAHLMGTLDPQRLAVGQIVTSKLDDEEVIHVVAQSFGLEVDGHDKASALGAIEGFLHEQARSGRRCLLIVDESQNLTVSALEELRMLSNFQLGNHPLLQTLLLGQPEFRATLQSSPDLEQLRQRVIAAHHLEPMEKGEIEPYIIHRLEKVGWDGNPAFDQRVFSELYEASDGIPRRINQVANRLMLLGAVEERTRIDSAMLKAVLDEMAGEKAFPQAAPKPMPKAEPKFEPVAPLKHEPRLDREAVEAMLAERDGTIAELQQAIVELANRQEDAVRLALMPEIATLQEKLARLEAKTFEQERTIRHTLTMLIEWIEGEMDETKAA
jgi:putative secretion ATPase (PEP-CTERM system associated)